MADKILEIKDLKREFKMGSEIVRAIDSRKIAPPRQAMKQLLSFQSVREPRVSTLELGSSPDPSGRLGLKRPQEPSPRPFRTEARLSQIDRDSTAPVCARALSWRRYRKKYPTTTLRCLNPTPLLRKRSRVWQENPVRRAPKRCQ